MLGIGTNRVFKAGVAPLVAKAQATSAAGGPCTSARAFGIAPSRGRILDGFVVKIDVTATGLNVRFMVTNRRGRAADLIDWYDDRGTSES